MLECLPPFVKTATFCGLKSSSMNNNNDFYFLSCIRLTLRLPYAELKESPNLCFIYLILCGLLQRLLSNIFSPPYVTAFVFVTVVS